MMAAGIASLPERGPLVPQPINCNRPAASPLDPASPPFNPVARPLLNLKRNPPLNPDLHQQTERSTTTAQPAPSPSPQAAAHESPKVAAVGIPYAAAAGNPISGHMMVAGITSIPSGTSLVPQPTPYIRPSASPLDLDSPPFNPTARPPWSLERNSFMNHVQHQQFKRPNIVPPVPNPPREAMVAAGTPYAAATGNPKAAAAANPSDRSQSDSHKLRCLPPHQFVLRCIDQGAGVYHMVPSDQEEGEITPSESNTGVETTCISPRVHSSGLPCCSPILPVQVASSSQGLLHPIQFGSITLPISNLTPYTNDDITFGTSLSRFPPIMLAPRKYGSKDGKPSISFSDYEFDMGEGSHMSVIL